MSDFRDFEWVWAECSKSALIEGRPAHIIPDLDGARLVHIIGWNSNEPVIIETALNSGWTFKKLVVQEEKPIPKPKRSLFEVVRDASFKAGYEFVHGSDFEALAEIICIAVEIWTSEREGK